jgi:hypothetical protein
MLPGSDSMIFGTYQWALAHSPSLQALLRQLAVADKKARYRLVPGLDPNYGSLLVHPTDEMYDIDIRVSILAWRRCGDALEPWIASALFLALETASKGNCRETSNPQHLHFVSETRKGAFAFQAKVRQELAASDPERLKDLPDGLLLHSYGFKPGVYPVSGSKKSPDFSRLPRCRLLPNGVQ